MPNALSFFFRLYQKRGESTLLSLPNKVRINEAQKSCQSGTPNIKGHVIRMEEVFQIVDLGVTECLHLRSKF